VTDVRVLLADDQQLVRQSLATMLGLLEGIELVETAANGQEVRELVAKHHPDVVLMDLNMPVMGGIEATERLSESDPGVAVIALTTFADDESVLGVLRAGARGYITKDASAEDIRCAILTVAAGDAAIDPTVQHHLVAAVASRETPSAGASHEQQCPDSELPDGLTPREAEVLALIADGLTNAEIAERLFVSPTTVKSHINHLFSKAGIRDRAQAVRYAYRHGLATPPS
jgi:DNA-binding NarL/FixJ family response regulator